MFPDFPVLIPSVASFLIAVTRYMIQIKEERFYLFTAAEVSSVVHSSASGPMLEESTVAAAAVKEGDSLHGRQEAERTRVSDFSPYFDAVTDRSI